MRRFKKDEARDPGEGLSREVKLVAGVVVLGVIMSVLDTTIVNVALDTLSRDLRSPLGTIQWVSTGYLLSLAMVIPLAGWLSERFGSKLVWMVAVAGFAVGSALCGIAGSAGSLIFFRVRQGFAVVLLIRGIGFGCSMMPAMASAYAVLRRDQVPEATSVLNTLQRVGGSIGTALLAVVLSDQAVAVLGSGATSGGLLQTLLPTVRGQVAAPLATAFGNTFWWAVAPSLLALIPVSVLVMTQRRERRATATRKLETVAT